MPLLSVVQIVAIIVGLSLTITQIHDLRKVNAGQIALDITRDIYSDERYKNNPIAIRLIQHDQPILKENGGPLDDQDLDNLLGEWGIVATFDQTGVLPDDIVLQEFSSDINRAYENHEVRNYINQTRKIYNDPQFFADFEWLAQWTEATYHR